MNLTSIAITTIICITILLLSIIDKVGKAVEKKNTKTIFDVLKEKESK